MTILDRCTNIRSQILQRNDLRRAHKEAEAFRARRAELVAGREAVAEAVARVLVLKAKGVAVAKLPTATTAMAVLADCERTLAESPFESGKDYGRLKKSIDKLGKDLLGVAEKGIESVRRDLPTVEEAFLKQVEMIPGYAAQVNGIRQQRDAIMSGNDPTESAKALEQFLDRREALRRLADDLKPTEFPSDVLEFFKAGRQGGGAPLEKLTTGVRQWLADRDLLKHVRVQVIVR